MGKRILTAKYIKGDELSQMIAENAPYGVMNPKRLASTLTSVRVSKLSYFNIPFTTDRMIL
jgi:hypothetical protein